MLSLQIKVWTDRQTDNDKPIFLQCINMGGIHTPSRPPLHSRNTHTQTPCACKTLMCPASNGHLLKNVTLIYDLGDKEKILRNKQVKYENSIT